MPQRTDRIKTLAAGSRFRVGPVLVHPERLAIERDGAEISLEPRIMELLVALAEHAGEVIGAEQLLIEVWRGTFYGDNPVHRAIGVLRRQLGDDLRNPVFIETIRKRGYRLIAPVAFPEDYRRNPSQVDGWAGRNPYLGLAAYDAEHAAVFFGRSRLTAEVLGALRRQRETQRRFLLLVGASGCGKTSLLRASVLPLLEQAGGFDGMQALSTTHCDFAATPDGDPMQPLAAALATWQLDGRPVFAPQPVEALAERLTASPEHVTEALDDAWRRRTARNDSEHAHLLLVVDHAEALVASDRIDDTQRRRAWAVIDALCAHPRGGTLMVVRGDFHAALIAALPDIAERKGSDGHIDATPPRAGEIAQIVRMPAYLSGLSFEEDPNTGARLDDVLRDAAADKPDTLPLLQYTLHALYERRRDDGLLTFEAYRDMGGLEGAVAHRAEAVFAELPGDVRAQLDHVLAQLIVMHSDSDSVSARRVPRSTLANDAARALVDTFVKGRLFVGGQAIDSPDFGVAHEALLRQWPRAREWAQDNRRLLQAKARMQRAAARWVEEGRSADHLLNPGRPLQEAREATRALPDDLTQDEHAFLSASARQHRRKRQLRILGIAWVVILTLLIVIAKVNDLAESKKMQEITRKEDERRRKMFAQFSFKFLTSQVYEFTWPRSILMTSGIYEMPELSLEDGAISQKEVESTLAEIESSAFCSKNKKLCDDFSGTNPSTSRTPDSNASLFKQILDRRNAAFMLGYLHFEGRRWNEAQEQFLINLESSEALVHLDPSNREWQKDVSYALSNLAVVAKQRDDMEHAIDYSTRSILLSKKLHYENPEDGVTEYFLTASMLWLSSAQYAEGDVGLIAVSAMKEKRANLLRRLIESNLISGSFSEVLLANDLRMTAQAKFNIGQIEAAERHIYESTSLIVKHLRSVSHRAPVRTHLAEALMLSADIASHSQSRSKVLDILRYALEQTKNEDRDRNTSRIRLNAMLRARIASRERNAEMMNGAVSDLVHLFEASRQDTETRLALLQAILLRGRMRMDEGRPDLAREDGARVIEILAPVLKDSRDLDILVPLILAHALTGSLEAVETQIDHLRRIGYRNPDYMAVIHHRNALASTASAGQNHGNTAAYPPQRQPRGATEALHSHTMPMSLPQLATHSSADWRSIGSDKLTTVEFQNLSSGTVHIDWINFQGRAEMVHKLTLFPGEHAERSTFTGHLWRATALDGAVLGYFVACDSPARAVIKDAAP